MADRENENYDIIWNYDIRSGQWRCTVTNSAFNDINSCGTKNHSPISAAIGNNFCEYFNEEGAVAFLQIYNSFSCSITCSIT